jgi:ABC-2 type transport system ATP-binding protein
MSDSVISIRQLSKTYNTGFLMNRKVRAVEQLSLEVAPGIIFGLVGPNGAGKSTTIKMVLNLVRPTSGEIRILGQPPSNSATRRELGFVPENPTPYPHLTGEEFVRMSGQLAGLSGNELNRQVDQVLTAVEMRHGAKLQIRRMSKGMVQRVTLAQALVAKPKLLVLDEPTSGLDPLGRRQFRDILLAQREAGVTIIFCTHIIPDVESLCDEVALIVGGKLQKSGDLTTILGRTEEHVEIELTGCEYTSVEAWGIPLASLKQLPVGVLARVTPPNSGSLLQKALDAKVNVVRVQTVRPGLEELFVQTVQQSGQLVGSQVTE